ncbi:MAG TPA: response regulator [Syntrophorhabdaceae bacterium]|nr:response regulator [Syntrophorhabdaceae bacterium]HNT69574.1 response regulator [Syntrophorhabdaceae bacterium]
MNEKKILIVDDEVAILDMLKEIFTMHGYQIVTAGSAEKALEILSNESIMVMFLDLKLPGMSGIDLCRQIRKDNQIAIIHALTGYVNVFGLLECRTAGFDDYFIKPANTKILLEAAESAFKKIERWKVDEYDLM